jgi:hypothetical protein
LTRHISDSKTREKFIAWTTENSLDYGILDEIDIEAEFGTDLNYNEAVELALQKFPTFWKSESVVRSENKPKQIIFVKDLVQKISQGMISVTYWKSPKVGMYYVMENRFRQKADSDRLLIEFYRTDRVNLYDLTDEEAQLEGIERTDEIRSVFEKWYGKPKPLLYRNWFKVRDA